MQLTKFSDYALRVLMYVHAAGDRRVTIEEMAASYRISRAHLMKVVNALTRAGYLTAVRGRSGGLTLARPGRDDPAGRGDPQHRARFRAGGMLRHREPVRHHRMLPPAGSLERGACRIPRNAGPAHLGRHRSQAARFPQGPCTGSIAPNRSQTGVRSLTRSAVPTHRRQRCHAGPQAPRSTSASSACAEHTA